jgi:cytosine/adenosine deaminase-related metal-dependent hydrolase
MNMLSSRDWHLLADRAPDFSVVHCPRCHSYFNRPTFPLEHFMALGLNLCLGTDSLASNHSLNMFSEMRHLLAKHAFVTPEEVLRMATVAGAKALGLSGELGEICDGASADLIAIPLEGNPPDVIEAVIHSKSPPVLVMVEGEIVHAK